MKTKKPVKKKRRPVKPAVKLDPSKALFTVHHPDFAGRFELAFECKGVNYYRCIKDFYYPVGRYKFIEARLAEADLRITTKLLKDYIKELLKHLDGKTGVINLVRVTELVINMKTHVDLEFSPMTIKRLAAVAYIDETEDVRDFDEEYGEKKIKFWEENGEYAFFLTRPIGELLNVGTTSEESLLKYIISMTDEEKSLISELYNPSSENL